MMNYLTIIRKLEALRMQASVGELSTNELQEFSELIDQVRNLSCELIRNEVRIEAAKGVLIGEKARFVTPEDMLRLLDLDKEGNELKTKTT